MTYLHTIRVTVLVDNTANGNDLIAEHGFSCLIEADGHRILFDTGAKDALLKNSMSLSVNLSKLDALVLSHGHYDHTGGLAAIIERLGLLRVVAHPNILGRIAVGALGAIETSGLRTHREWHWIGSTPCFNKPPLR